MTPEDIQLRANRLAEQHYKLYEDGSGSIEEAIAAGIKEALTTLGVPVQDRGLWLPEESVAKVQQSYGTDAYVNVYVATAQIEKELIPFYSAKDSISKEDLERLIEAYITFKGHTDTFVRELMERYL